MNIDEIRKNAPMAATHYKISSRFMLDDEVIYYQKCGGLWLQKITDSAHIVCDQKTLLVDKLKPLH